MAAQTAGHRIPCHTAASSSSSTPRSIYSTSLNPIKRKLDRIETERVYRVVQRCSRNILQVKLLSWLIEDDSRLFLITDEELRRLVLNHQHLVRTSAEIDLLKLSTKSILRYCASHSIQLSSFNKKQTTIVSTSPSSGVDNLRNFTEELQEIMHEKLLSENNEERARWKYLLQTMEKSRVAFNACQQLRNSLENCTALKDQVIGIKDIEITELKLSLESTQQRVDKENNNSLNQAAKQILFSQKSLGTKIKKLYQDRFQYIDNLAKSTPANYEKESKLRKRKFKMAGELQNWILKYDQNMGWRQDKIDQLYDLNKKDLENLEELEKHFETLSKEYDAIMEEQKLIAEEKLRKENELRELILAAVKIQAAWRGYETRKLLSKRANGGKKGAGDRKKGKKKKK